LACWALSLASAALWSAASFLACLIYSALSLSSASRFLARARSVSFFIEALVFLRSAASFAFYAAREAAILALVALRLLAYFFASAY
jgi:hypothetical protein